LYEHSVDRSGQKPIKNFRKSSRGRTQGLSKIFRSPIRRAHRAVIFAIAQFSCSFAGYSGIKVSEERDVGFGFALFYGDKASISRFRVYILTQQVVSILPAQVRGPLI